MPRSTNFVQDVISRQERVLRLAERDYDLTLTVLSAETGIPKPTLSSWMKDTAMPAYGLVLLCRVIPDDLTSLMFEPVGKHIGTNEGKDGDLDALAREAAGFNVEYLDAHHPDSEAGSRLSPRERARLKDKARRVASTAQSAAA
jgi:hypothetical protein